VLSAITRTISLLKRKTLMKFTIATRSSMTPKTPSKALNVSLKYVAKTMNQKLNGNIAGISMRKTWLLSRSKWMRGRLKELRKILKS
jgi:hypothetical protein